MQHNTFFSLEQVIDRQPITVSVETPLYEAIALMHQHGNRCTIAEGELNTTVRSNSSCVLVVEGERLRGIFTERDLVKLVARRTDTKGVTVGEMMTENVVSIVATDDKDIFSALTLLKEYRIRHLPVVDESQNLLGLITAKSIRQKLQPINLMKWRKVAEVMESKVIHAAPDESIQSIASLMADNKISCVAIADTQKDADTNRLVQPIGIITERDIVQFQNLNLDLELPARDYMSAPLFLVRPEDSLWDIYQQMKQRRVRRLLVGGDKGELVGIITQSSLLQIFDPTEMYGIIEVLQRQVSQLETEREALLQERNSELEREVQERTAVIAARDRELAFHMNNSPLAVVEWDKEFRVKRWSERAEQMFGWQEAEVMGKHWNEWQFVFREDFSSVTKIANCLLNGTEPRNVSQNRNHTKDGKVIDCEWYNSILLDEAGNLVSILSLAQNISDRQNALRDLTSAKASLGESQERYTLAVNGSSSGLWDWNIATDEVFYAPRWKEILGCTDAELPNTFEAWSSRLHPEDRDRVLAALQDHLENRVPYNIEYRLLKKDEEYCWVQGRGQAIWDDNGQPIRMAGSITDISDRKRREAILKDIASGMCIDVGENFLPSLVEYLSKTLQVDCAYVGKLVQPTADSIQTQAVYSQGKIDNNFEYGLAGTPCLNVVEQQLCVYPEAVQQLFPDSILLAQMEAESFAGMPIYSSDSDVVGLICVVDSKPFEDVPLIEEVLKIFATRATAELERQQVTSELQKSNLVLQAISSIQTQFLADVEPGIIFDGMLEHLLELTESEYGFIGEIHIADDGSPIMSESYMKFRGRPYLKTHAITNIAWNEETRVFYAENAPKGMEFHNLQTLFGAVIVTGKPVIANSPSDDPRRGGLPDGHPPLNSFLGVPFYKNGQMTGMAGIANRRGGYDASIIEYLRPLLDTCSRIIEAYKSERQAALRERQRQQAEAKVGEQAALLDIANDAIMVRDADDRILFWNQGAEKLYGWSKAEALNKNAKDLFNRRSTVKLNTIHQAIRECGEWQGELNQVTKAGEEVIVNSRWSLVKDKIGNPQAYLVVKTDITEQKQLEAQFLRTQRLESLGTLAGGIAHDLNNILAPILGFSKLLPLKLPDIDEQTKGFFKIMENNANRGSALVKQILTFSRGLEGDKGVVQVRHLITEIAQIINETFPKSIELEIDAPKTLWTVNADINQLHQVLMNLSVNARDAMPNGGKLRIDAENTTVDAEYARLHLDATEGSYVSIAVSDTGVGIPLNIIDRIFEPFFTTKEVGRGTGLGLSTVIGIIKSHDGFVEVTSDRKGKNKGTQFKVFLPASDLLENSEESTEEILQGNRELVLVVDDETAILQVTKATLETYNYQVLTASNGIEAIATYARERNIDVVIMDIMMPSMDGKTAIRTIKQIDPEVKIIAVSGLIERQEIVSELDSEVIAFLNKPYSNDDLLRTIAEIIND